MDDQYGGLADLRQYMNGVRTHFTAIPPPPPQPVDLFSGGRNLTLESQNNHHHHHHHHHNNPYDMVMGRAAVVDLVRPHQGGILDLHHHHHHEFPSDSTGGGGGAAAASSGASLNGLEMDGGGGGGGVGFGDVGGGSGRWPRQETLTLLEIRSRLDSKFKEANQKGPLWDEVSRIMSEEHGYQRSGKKCREKFENLYKYYKKTKEGKAGRQDGKHYRFFRQLEALYGDHTTPISTSEAHLMGNDFHFHNPNNSNITQPNQESFFQAPKHCDSHSLSLSNSSEFDTSSSDGNEMNKKKRGGRRSWKSKIKEFIDIQMRKLMEKQEEWLEKMTKTLERKEQERVVREEEWRQQERERVEREHKFWANERAWIEARDAALMEALHKLTGKEVVKGDQEVHRNENGSETISNAHWRGESWPESEVAKMIELRVSMESRFEQSGCSEEVVWEEIAAKMGCFGYERSGLMCKEKWDRINSYIGKTNKKRKENYSRGSCYYQGNEGFYNNQGEGGGYCEIVNEQRPAEIITRIVASDHGSSTPNSNAGNAIPDSCFRFLVGSSDDHGENLWQNYSHVKLGKGGN